MNAAKAPAARFAVLTLFPEMILNGLCHSVIKRAREAGLIFFDAVNIRDFSADKHKRADDYPYGGGNGMVMSAEPVYRAYLYTMEMFSSLGVVPRVLYMTPRGAPFRQSTAQSLSHSRNILLICGHYEGIDERAIELINPEEISIGDFILTGGEIAAMTVIDATARLVPGVLSNENSCLDESFSNGLLEYPQYTRPPVFMGMKVPDVLLSGHHENINKWRLEQSKSITRSRRPDLL